MRAAVDRDKRAPGRPRSVRADEAIIDAVLAMLMEGTPVDGLSVEAVAARAGVGKATIYRRWPCKDALVVDAVASVKPPLPPIAGVDLRDDLVALVRGAGPAPEQRPEEGVLPCLIPQLQRSGDLQRLFQRIVEPRREAMREVLRRGVSTGELREDLDIEITIAALTAPMVLQKMLRWNPALDVQEIPERVVDAVLAGARVHRP